MPEWRQIVDIQRINVSCLVFVVPLLRRFAHFFISIIFNIQYNDDSQQTALWWTIHHSSSQNYDGGLMDFSILNPFEATSKQRQHILAQQPVCLSIPVSVHLHNNNSVNIKYHPSIYLTTHLPDGRWHWQAQRSMKRATTTAAAAAEQFVSKRQTALHGDGGGGVVR